MPRIIAIDLGTSTCKSAAYSDGRVVASRSLPVSTRFPFPGGAEQDPAEWFEGVRDVVRATRSEAGFESVDAIGLTAESDTLVVVDHECQVIRPAMLWMDSRGINEARQLSQSLGDTLIYERTGMRSAHNFTLPKAAWLRTHEASNFARVRWLLQPKDILFHWLTGRILTDPSSAARTLAYDFANGAWWQPPLDELGLPARLLPPISPSSTESAGLTHAAAEALGLRSGTPVAVGAADRAAEALGLATTSQRAMVSSGTATGVCVTFPLNHRVTNVRVITPHHALSGELLALASIPTTGAVLDWLARLTGGHGHVDSRQLLHEAAQSRPGSGGTAAGLSFAGSRSLTWDPLARGAFLGLELGTTRGDLARAVVEGIALETRAIVDAFNATITTVTELALTGGLHRNAFVCQTMADVTGIPATSYPDSNAALTGAMLLADPSLTTVEEQQQGALAQLRRGQAFLPDPRRHAFYQGLSPQGLERGPQHDKDQ